MKHLYLQRKGDREQILSSHKHFKEKSKQELVDSYNQSVKTGIVGVHAQALHLIALRIEFLKRFKKSPITIINNSVISLTGKIKLKGNTYVEQLDVFKTSSTNLKSCNDNQKNISRMMKELKSSFIQTKQIFNWWINRY